MILYNLRSADGEWRISKFDDDLNVESSYIVSRSKCECPQWTGRQKQCRHMKMLPMMLERADSPWYFCFDDAQWYDPLGEVLAEATTELIFKHVIEETHRPLKVEETLPKGITVVSIDSLTEMHNAIADAVGEPRMKRRV